MKNILILILSLSGLMHAVVDYEHVVVVSRRRTSVKRIREASLRQSEPAVEDNISTQEELLIEFLQSYRVASFFKDACWKYLKSIHARRCELENDIWSLDCCRCELKASSKLYALSDFAFTTSYFFENRANLHDCNLVVKQIEPTFVQVLVELPLESDKFFAKFVYMGFVVDLITLNVYVIREDGIASIPLGRLIENDDCQCSFNIHHISDLNFNILDVSIPLLHVPVVHCGEEKIYFD